MHTKLVGPKAETEDRTVFKKAGFSNHVRNVSLHVPLSTRNLKTMGSKPKRLFFPKPAEGLRMLYER